MTPSEISCLSNTGKGPLNTWELLGLNKDMLHISRSGSPANEHPPCISCILPCHLPVRSSRSFICMWSCVCVCACLQCQELIHRNMISIFQLRSNYKDIDAVLFSLQNTMIFTLYYSSHMIVSNETQIRIAVRDWWQLRPSQTVVLVPLAFSRSAMRMNCSSGFHWTFSMCKPKPSDCEGSVAQVQGPGQDIGNPTHKAALR